MQRAKTDGVKTIRNRPAKKGILAKQNTGVEIRAKRDEEQKKEEEPSLDKVKFTNINGKLSSFVFNSLCLSLV